MLALRHLEIAEPAIIWNTALNVDLFQDDFGGVGSRFRLVRTSIAFISCPGRSPPSGAIKSFQTLHGICRYVTDEANISVVS